jgi:phosphohistidine phosphatase
MGPSHTLVVIRHAKAVQTAASDHERGLTDQGRADAAAAGAWLASIRVVPSRALVSAASRAVQTWESLASGAGWSLRPDLDGGLYTAGPDTALDMLRALDEDCACAVLVGHNPTVASLAQLLDDRDGDPAAGNAMATAGFPTSAVAVFDLPGTWADLDSARLTAFRVGRGVA